MAFWKPGTGRPGASSLGGAENGQEDGDDGSLFIFPSSRFGSGGGLQKQRQQLPVFKHRKALLYLAEKHGTTIVLGETGSGKSTQIPQYFAEAGWAEGGRMIACTQPRRIAAQVKCTLFCSCCHNAGSDQQLPKLMILSEAS
jgi:ATP-dependent RNA helicase DDX35